MKTNSRKITIYVNSGLIVFTSTLLFFVFDIYKNSTNFQSYIDSNLFNWGVGICLISLPILAFYSYLFSKIATNPKENPNLKRQIANTIMQNIFFWILNIVGICLAFTPFYLKINNRMVSFRDLAVGGIILGIILFVTNNRLLINAKNKKEDSIQQ